MTSILPESRPEMSHNAATNLVSAHGITGPALLGRRAYYRDSLGVVGVNDRGIYDDAVFVITSDCFVAFNANCDPSRTRPGMAVLKAGVWDYKIGIHNISKDPTEHPHYKALVQAAPVTVMRDGNGVETGWFGINIHKGGYTTTSSEGCQTIYPDQWNEFIATVEREMNTHHLSTIPYILTERESA